LFWEASTSLWKNKSIATILGYTPQAQLNGTGFVKASGTSITYDNSTYVTTDTFQTISASKTFSVGLSLASAGGTNQITSFVNTNSIHSGSTATNVLGFNNSNNIYFGKGLNNGGVITFNNAAVRFYALPDADGTIALVGGSGVGTVTSVAALTIGTSGTDLSSSVANGTTTPVITLNVPTASATNRGALSSADWTKFNNNIPAGTPTSGDFVFYNGSNLAYRGILANAPLSYNSSTSTLSISQASGSANGYLSSTDWTTFNNKQSALTNPVTGTGTTNYLPKFTGASTIGNSILQETGGFLLTDKGVSTMFGVAIATSSSNGGNLTIKAGGGFGSGNTAGNLYLAFGRGNSSASNGNMYFGLAQSTDTVGLDTTYMTLNASGNLGLGVTPSAFSVTALQVKSAAIFEYANNNISFGSNIYFDGSNRYISSTSASNYQQTGGAHYWYTAPSGTAGNAISFTQAMTLNASGNLLVGTTSTYYSNNLIVAAGSEGGITIANTGTTGAQYLMFADGTTGADRYRGYMTYNHTDNSMSFATNANIFLSATSTGAATFSSSVTAGGNVKSSPTSTQYIEIGYDTGSNQGFIQSVYSGVGYKNTLINPNGGNVGIGTTSPNVNGLSTAITINGTSTSGLEINANGVNQGYLIASTSLMILNARTSIPLLFYTTDTERMRITSGGALCLGVTSAYGTNLLNVNGGIYATGAIAAVIASDIDMHIFQNTGATYTKAAMVASIAATGGTGSYFFYGQQSTSTVALKIFSNGNIQNTNNSYGAISDARLKENIIDATPKLDDLMKVKVRNYNLKGESSKQLGVISQELETIFPNMIEESTNMGSDVKIKGVKYSVFVPMLIKAVQELKAEIEILKNK
jgi:hypothetical protein